MFSRHGEIFTKVQPTLYIGWFGLIFQRQAVKSFDSELRRFFFGFCFDLPAIGSQVLRGADSELRLFADPASQLRSSLLAAEETTCEIGRNFS